MDNNKKVLSFVKENGELIIDKCEKYEKQWSWAKNVGTYTYSE